MRICLAGLLLLLISGCQRSTVSDGERHVFRYNEASGISSLDPAFARGQADIWACNQLYNGLVQLDDSLNILPCIARSWRISEDGKTYIFTLRNDIYFHDHELFTDPDTRRVTAYDFEYSFHRILLPSLASPGTWVFNNVAIDSITGKAMFHAWNDSTFTITLKNAFPPFLGLLTSKYCSVVPEEIVEHYGKDFRDNPVGTGPFRFHQWVERTALVFHRNDDYFEIENGAQLPYLDAIQISFISDRQSAFLEFIKGRFDFLSGLDASYKDEVLSRSGELREKYKGKVRLIKAPYLNTEYLGILLDQPQGNVLSDPRIRMAINKGFDRRRMIRFLRNNIGIPGEFGVIPPGLPSFSNSRDRGYMYDPQGARALLAEAGYPDGKGIPEIVISTTKEYQDLCEFIQGQLNQIGFRIRLEVNPGATQRELVAKQELDFFRASWIADYPDAENYLSLFYSKNKAPAGPNYTHFSDPEFDRLYETASVTTNDSARFSIYREMDRMIMQQAPVVVLYYDEVVRFSQTDIQGLGINPMNLLDLRRVRKVSPSSRQ